MANRTVKYAVSVHGTNPQYLIDNIVRKRIYQVEYWKKNCTLLNSAKVLEKAIDDLKYIGGTYGGQTKPTQFLCLVLKLLQIQPDKEIIYLFIDQEDFKYLRALGAYYLRLVGTPVEVHQRLEPLLQDFRKLRVVDRAHKFSVMHMDEFIDNLLREERFFDVVMPRMTKRTVLEANRDLEPYKSKLEDLDLIPPEPSNFLASRAVGHQSQELKVPNESRSRHRSRSPPSYERTRHGAHHNREPESSSRHSQSSNQSLAKPGTDDRNLPSSSGRKKYSRWEQDEIDEFNSIRAKLGLKPLRT